MSALSVWSGFRRGLATLLASILCIAVAPPLRAEDDVQLAGPLLRTTLVVRDLDAAARLFRDVLGMRVAVDIGIDGPAVNALLGTRDKRVRIVIFDLDGSPTGRIAVMAYEESGSPADSTGSAEVTSVGTGTVVLVLETRDIDQVHERVRSAGYPIISAPQVVFERPDMAVQSREMIFVGPEGVAVNLLQRGTAVAGGQ